jgi:hypothetical protein
MSELDNIAPGGIIQLGNSPSALDDATFDSLFPADGTSVAVAPAQQVTQPVGNTATQQSQTQAQSTTNANEPFLKGNTSVYKTPEAAIAGLNQKDALIEQLRQRYALTTGLDPITNQPVGQRLQPQADANDYSVNPTKYMDDLYAATKQGPEAYAAVQEKFIMDKLKPLAPVMTQAARGQALESVARENAEIPKFVGTETYGRTLDENPDLKEAIATAERDYRFHSRLPGLYKLAYLTGQGMQLPEILKASTQTSKSTPSQNQQQVRTTMQNGTLSAAVETTGDKASFKDIKGIKATIAQMEAKGVNLGSW